MLAAVQNAVGLTGHIAFFTVETMCLDIQYVYFLLPSPSQLDF